MTAPTQTDTEARLAALEECLRKPQTVADCDRVIAEAQRRKVQLQAAQQVQQRRYTPPPLSFHEEHGGDTVAIRDDAMHILYPDGATDTGGGSGGSLFRPVPTEPHNRIRRQLHYRDTFAQMLAQLAASLRKAISDTTRFGHFNISWRGWPVLRFGPEPVDQQGQRDYPTMLSIIQAAGGEQEVALQGLEAELALLPVEYRDSVKGAPVRIRKHLAAVQQEPEPLTERQQLQEALEQLGRL